MRTSQAAQLARLDAEVLVAVRIYLGLRVSEIVRATERGRSTVESSVGRLIRDGLVVRRRRWFDGRGACWAHFDAALFPSAGPDNVGEDVYGHGWAP